MADTREVAVKFSGGRDSSLVAATYCLRRRRVHLLRFATGFGIPSGLPEIREHELREAFPGSLADTTPVLAVYGLVRRIATAEIESDFRQFQGFNLLLLGEALALHAASVAYCVREGIPVLADGSSGYQVDLPEQRAVALMCFRELASNYNIEYETPLTTYQSADVVKYELLELGISTKSLEGVSMFSDTFSVAPDDVVARYLAAKRPIAEGYIRRMIAG